MKRLPHLVAWLLVLASAAASQPIEITGTVVDAETGAPISHARVTAEIMTDIRHPYGDVLVATTGDDGRFRFTGLPPSDCRFQGEKAGYSKAHPYGSSSIKLQPDKPSVPIKLVLTPLGGINVTVIDDQGFPVAGTQLEITGQPATARLVLPGFEVTGKDGSSRNLFPRGSYRIRAVSPGSGTLLRARGQTFLPTYYPNAVDVVPGKETRVDLHVTPVPAREIRGRFTSQSCLQLMVAPAGEKQQYSTIWGIVQCDKQSGEFRISGLAPGAYVIQGAGLSPITVNVSNRDIDDMVIPSTSPPSRQ